MLFQIGPREALEQLSVLDIEQHELHRGPLLTELSHRVLISQTWDQTTKNQELVEAIKGVIEDAPWTFCLGEKAVSLREQELSEG